MSIEYKCRQALDKAGIDVCADVTTISLRILNKVLRASDDSSLYPILGRFNATERAIRWYSRVFFRANGACSNHEYILGIEHKLSCIVNSVN